MVNFRGGHRRILAARKMNFPIKGRRGGRYTSPNVPALIIPLIVGRVQTFLLPFVLVMVEAFIAILSSQKLCLVKPEKSEKPCSRKVGKLLIQPLRVAKDTIDLVSAAPAGNY